VQAAIDRAIEHGNRWQRDRAQGQHHLFGGDEGGDGERAVEALPEAAPWSDTQRLTFEKEALGLYLSGHPTREYAEEIEALGAMTVAQLNESVPDVRVGGIVESVRLLRTRRGDRMATFKLGDHEGAVEVVVFPEAYKTCATLVATDTLVMVRGKLEADDESVRLLATEIVPLEQVRELATAEVAIRLAVPPHGRETFETLADVFTRYRGDRPVRFELELTKGERPLRVCADVGQVRVRPSAGLVDELERICGEGTVTLRRHRGA
jgi:DNA polymerase-3 subunit alpha